MPATISFTTEFDLTSTPKKFNFEDTSDYVGQGIALADVNGSFKITSPSGIVIYNNLSYTNAGCDIQNSVARTNQSTINLPLDADGNVEQGVYTILYTVYDVKVEYYTVTNTYTVDYATPTLKIQQTVDCVTPLFTSKDATSYVVNGITPTITGTHTLTFPVGSGLTADTAAITGTGSTITEGKEEFANGTQTTTIESEMTYVFADGLTIVDSLTGFQEFKVDCTFICSIYCCLSELETRIANAAGVNQTEYNRLVTISGHIAFLQGLAQLAISCGKPDDVDAYLAEMQRILECNNNCGCSGDDPALVTGIGGTGNTVVVDSISSSIIVTSTIAGSTTTYHLTVNPTVTATIAALYNTALTSGTYVTATPSGIIGGIQTYTLTGVVTLIAAGYGIEVTDSGVVAGTRTFTIASSLVVTRAETATAYAVPAGTSNIVTNCTATAPTTGTYQISMEADGNITGNNGVIAYRLVKNDVTLLNADRNIVSSNFGATIALPVKLVCSGSNIALTAGDTVKLSIDNTLTGLTLAGRSIVLTRTA